jgi:hypothetical protein
MTEQKLYREQEPPTDSSLLPNAPQKSYKAQAFENQG